MSRSSGGNLIIARGWADTDRVTKLRDEARQLVAIVVTSIRTARRTPRSIFAFRHFAFRIRCSLIGSSFKLPPAPEVRGPSSFRREKFVPKAGPTARGARAAASM